MPNKKIYLSSPTMHGEEQKYIKEAFDTNWVAPLGKNVDEFEKEMASYVGTKYAAALTSGTAALHLALKLAFKDLYGDNKSAGTVGANLLENGKAAPEVLCSDMTFAATVNPVSYEGGKQVFVESERTTWNMDPAALEEAFKKHPNAKIVLVANLYGTPSQLEEIAKIAKAHDAILIEDAAESLSATVRMADGSIKSTGTFGKYNAISFNGNKIITTSGGGMLLSDDEAAIAKARFWATQARDQAPWYEHTELGFNYRMSNIIAGIGRGQLPHIEEHREKKEWIYKYYKEALKDLPIEMNPYKEGDKPNFWLSCLTINKDAIAKGITPEKLAAALSEQNIESRPIWKPMHLQPVYQGHDFITLSDPVGDDVFARGICLPSDIKNTEEDMELIVKTIKSVF